MVVEMTDGTSQANAEFRRSVGCYYDLVKANVERILKGLTAELEDHPVTAVGVTPGWLRSERMLETSVSPRPPGHRGHRDSRFRDLRISRLRRQGRCRARPGRRC